MAKVGIYKGRPRIVRGRPRIGCCCGGKGGSACAWCLDGLGPSTISAALSMTFDTSCESAGFGSLHGLVSSWSDTLTLTFAGIIGGDENACRWLAYGDTPVVRHHNGSTVCSGATVVNLVPYIALNRRPMPGFGSPVWRLDAWLADIAGNPYISGPGAIFPNAGLPGPPNVFDVPCTEGGTISRSNQQTLDFTNRITSATLTFTPIF